MPDPSEQRQAYAEDRCAENEAASSIVVEQSQMDPNFGCRGSFVEEQMPAAQASEPIARIGELITKDIVPRLKQAHASAARANGHAQSSAGMPILGGGPRANCLGRAGLERFTASVVNGDSTGAIVEIEAWLKRGVKLEDITVEAFGHAAHLFGESWLTDRMNFLEVTINLSRLHMLLQELPRAEAANPRPAVRSILLASAPGEGHLLGIDIVGWLFSRAGWNVTSYAGAATDGELIADVAASGYSAIGLSASTPERLDGLTALVSQLKQRSINPEMVVMIGGRAVHERAQAALAAGADAAIADARLAVATIAALADERAGRAEPLDGFVP